MFSTELDKNNKRMLKAIRGDNRGIKVSYSKLTITPQAFYNLCDINEGKVKVKHYERAYLPPVINEDFIPYKRYPVYAKDKV